MLLAPQAEAYEFATDTGGPDGEALSWYPEDRPIPFTQHVLGGGGIPTWILHGAARSAARTWSDVESADLSFEEQGVYGGLACPHSLPSTDPDFVESVCGGPVQAHDYRSAFFFIETVWPFGEEVIALTTLSWAEGARLVDADISFNGLNYPWSASSTDIQVDYESIVLHELGHFVGLDHSTEPGAVMGVDYDTGTLVRALGEDDVAGISELYPCASVPCRGDVGYAEGQSCSGISLAWAPGLVGFLLGLGVLAAVRRERCRRAGLVLFPLGLALVLLPSPGTSSTVLELGVTDLAARSDRVVRARVISVEPYFDRVVRSRITLEPLETLSGVESLESIALDQPGGRLEERGTRVFGMPEFEPGTEVVVFVSEDGPLGARVVGLAQGLFEVRPDGRLERDTSGLSLARVGGSRIPAPIVAPGTLAGLRAALAP